MSTTAPFFSRLLALFLGIGLMYGSVLLYRAVPDQLRKSGLANLRSQLRSQEHEAALETLQILAGTTRPLEVLPFPPLEEFAPLAWGNFIARTERKVGLLHLIEDEEFESPELRPALALFSEAQRQDLRQSIDLTLKQDKELASSSKNHERLKNRKKQLGQQLFLLSNDLRALFNLPLTLLKDDEVESPPPLFYESGYLAGLPVFPEFSGPPADPAELREQLESLEIPLPELAPKKFNTRLESLRQTSERIRTSLASTTKDEAELAKSRAELEMLRGATKAGLRRTILYAIDSDLKSWDL